MTYDELISALTSLREKEALKIANHEEANTDTFYILDSAVQSIQRAKKDRKRYKRYKRKYLALKVNYERILSKISSTSFDK